MGDLELVGLKALLAEATPGPWRFDGDWHRFPTVFGANGAQVATIEKRGVPERFSHTAQQAADARLIVAAKTQIPTLIQRIEALEEALKPFAEAAEAFNDCEQHPNGCPDSAQAGELVDLTVGDFRRARSALTPTKGR